MRKDKIMSHDEEIHALLERARRYCAMAEQCESGVRQKLVTWGCHADDADPIVARLREEGYIDDLRYARTYCESKIANQQWSRQKVLYQLRLKRLPKEAIDAGMATVSNEAYMTMLAELAAKKRDELAATYGDDTSRRLEAFLAQRGFTFDEINQAIKNIAGK